MYVVALFIKYIAKSNFGGLLVALCFLQPYLVQGIDRYFKSY